MVKKFKICFVSISAYPLFNLKCNKTFGGAEVQIYNLSRELAKNKFFEVSVIVGDFGQKDIEIFENVKVIKSFSLSKKFINYFKGPFKLYRTFKKINPDVVICRAFGVEVGISSFFCKLSKKKFIYSIAHKNDTDGTFFKGLIGNLFLYSLKNANYLIAQNNEQIGNFETFLNNKIKTIKVIPSGYQIKNNINLYNKKYVLWVGRSDDWKRPELFIKLADKFQNQRFIMIMPKSSNLEVWNKYSQLAKNKKNVQFIEKVPFNKIQKYFDEANIFVNTSISEGFPNTFIQAGLGATPILSLNVDPDNFIGNNNIGFFCNNDFELMVDKLNLLLYDKNIYKEYSRNIFNYVKKRHDIEKITLIWSEVIIKCLDSD